jgi:hypothetical protein
MDLPHNRMRVFRAGAEKLDEVSDETIDGLDNPLLHERYGLDYDNAAGELELLQAATPPLDREAFLAGEQSPLFFGSAVNNFGVREVLDALVALAPPPGARAAIQRVVQPTEDKFTGVVFKVQANMDPAHRDRIAFVRVSSGRFNRGMRLKVTRTGKEMRPQTVVSFLSQRRELVDEAVAGDIIGIPNHGTLQLGDTLTEGEALTFTGLPFFAPESFRNVEINDPLRSKQLRQGLQQLGEEGAIQVFNPAAGGSLMLGAIGQLQFEVVLHRLKSEYGVDARLEPCRFTIARWITSDSKDKLERFLRTHAHCLRRGGRARLPGAVQQRPARGPGAHARHPLPLDARAFRPGVRQPARLMQAAAPAPGPLKRVLVLRYSQTGQLSALVEHLIAPLRADPQVAVQVLDLVPLRPFPFPWSFFRFLDAFPESAHLVPPPLAPLGLRGDESFDLVILPYQVWFLAPSQPITAFLKHPAAQQLLRGKPVVGVIACRNMWMAAHDKVQQMLQAAGARLIDNVVYTDPAHTLATFITTPRWLLTGRKNSFWGLPAAGLNEAQLRGARRFGRALCEALRTDLERGQAPLLAGLGAVQVDPKLYFSERTGTRSFYVWGKLLMAAGPPGSLRRLPLLLLYVTFLVTMIATLVPPSLLLQRLLRPWMQGWMDNVQHQYEQPSGSSRERSHSHED